MKRNYFVIVAVIGVVLLLLNGSQAQVQPFDLRKCQQELEIMKGILRTTLRFASQELASSAKSDKVETKTAPKRVVIGRGGDFSIGAFYLAGQGAVFTIPTSSVRDLMRARKEDLAFAFAADMKGRGWNGAWTEQLGNQLNELNAQLQDEFGLDGFPVLSAVPAPPVAPQPPARAVSPASPAPAPKPPQPGQAKDSSEGDSAREKQLRQKLAELQEKVKQRGEEEETRQAKFRESLSQLKGFLMEALANHGDSLSVVKPGEYVNLVLVDEGNRWFGLGDDSGDRAQREILSVQKSVITDFKTGKLSLEAFKQKVLNYMN